jgi:hypothetical protein
MKYFVTLKFEDTFEIEASTEDEAICKASQMFDPTQDGPELVEVWSDEEEENYHEI